VSDGPQSRGEAEAFYEPLGDGRFRSTAHTSGPWDVRSQHAGPPAALLGRALERTEPREGTLLARVTFEILGPVPVAEVEVQSQVLRPGRTVELLEAQLSAGGRPVMTARAWRLPATEAPEATAPDAAGPPPRPDEETAPPHDFGYGHAVELRFAAGGWFDSGPATAWTRLKVGIVPGEEPSPLQRVLAVADSGNGISAVMSWDDWLFINPELTVHVVRPPAGEWVVLDAATTIAPGGAGLARSTLSDETGPVAYGAQSLLVTPR